MKFCKYCGSQIDSDARFCTVCGKALTESAPVRSEPQADVVQNEPETKKNVAADIWSKVSSAVNSLFDKLNLPAKARIPVLAGVPLAVAAVVIIIIAAASGNCDYGSCKNKAVAGSDYCFDHKCAITGCDSPVYSYSNYCFSHYLLYDDDASSSNDYVYSSQLKISNVRVYSSSNYTYAEGTITNTSDTTVSFVEIKGAFENSYGTVVDTDWTYAVGSEGLAPGESCKWKLSVDKDYSIVDCSISILDFDY